LFCVIDGPTRGWPWSSANARVEFRRLAAQAGIRRRVAPHQLRHAHAVELAREGVPLNVIQRQLGYANLGTTSISLQGIDTGEIIATVHARRARMMSATAGLQRRTTTRTASAGAKQPLPLPAQAGHPLCAPMRSSQGPCALSLRARCSSRAGFVEGRLRRPLVARKQQLLGRARR
jgi:integrase/recombinase XerD